MLLGFLEGREYVSRIPPHEWFADAGVELAETLLKTTSIPHRIAWTYGAGISAKLVNAEARVTYVASVLDVTRHLCLSEEREFMHLCDLIRLALLYPPANWDKVLDTLRVACHRRHP